MNGNTKPERTPTMIRLDGYLLDWLDLLANLYDSKRGPIGRLLLRAIFWHTHRDGEEMAIPRLAQFLMEAGMVRQSRGAAQGLLTQSSVAERNKLPTVLADLGSDSAAVESGRTATPETGNSYRPARPSRTTRRLAQSRLEAAGLAVGMALSLTPFQRTQYRFA